MQINITKIVEEKLAQMEQDGVIQKAIEDGIEKSILSAVTSAVTGYQFKREIENQVEDAVGGIAGKCGLSSYNGFIAQKAAEIVQNMYNNDIANKVQKALDETLMGRYENIKLSEIFDKYREWVKGHTDDSDQYEYKQFTCRLEQKDYGLFQHLTCKFADHPIEDSSCGEIEIRFYRYIEAEKVRISRLWLNDHDMRQSIRIGTLTSFEAFLVNLYYNETEVEMDVENVNEDNYYDIDI